ncbi:MAG: ferric reductase-like transmembrane domain-containing protein [Streptosporangiaceae bacterium]
MASSSVFPGSLAAGHLLAAGGYSPSPLWIATRATGVVALVLLTMTVALGVAGTARLSTPQLPRLVRAGLHRNVSLLAVAFVAVHVLTTVLDPYARIGFASAIVPFSSAYRPLWLSLGTIAFDLLLAIVITSLVRSRLSYRTWRAVHWLAYASWPVALWHGLGTGTDSKLSWLLVLDAICVVAVAATVAWRLTLAPRGGLRIAGMLATGGFVLATVGFVAIGPLQSGWARRAGTPAALVGSATTARIPAVTMSADYAGQVRRNPAGPEQVVIRVSARTTARPAHALTIVLKGTPDGSAISMSSGTVRFDAVPGGQTYAGPVTVLTGHRLTAALRGPAGQRAQARLTLVITGSRAAGRIVIGPGAQA